MFRFTKWYYPALLIFVSFSALSADCPLEFFISNQRVSQKSLEQFSDIRDAIIKKSVNVLETSDWVNKYEDISTAIDAILLFRAPEAIDALIKLIPSEPKMQSVNGSVPEKRTLFALSQFGESAVTRIFELSMLFDLKTNDENIAKTLRGMDIVISKIHHENNNSISLSIQRHLLFIGNPERERRFRESYFFRKYYTENPTK